MRIFYYFFNTRFLSIRRLFTSKGNSVLKNMADSTVVGAKRTIDEPDSANKRLCHTSSEDRIKKRKVALLMGYCGQGYLGMQRNHGFKTIEEDLMTALFKANLITEDSFKQMQILQFQRAARTDKGVSAVRQLVSLKLPETTKIEDINAHLPETIKIFALKRVTKGFNSKSSCDARTYSYLLPTSAFSNTDDSDDYRITPDVLDKIRDALQVFTGTHNFHNFTAKKKAQDPSAFRYILNFECEEPFVADGLELITLKVKGQSFMLHQIRKMVGTVIAIVRGLTTKETITGAWGESRFDLPIAPGLGLVLEQVHYDRYNTKFGTDGMHECLLWDDKEAEIAEFKKKYIDPVIVQTELQEKSMYNWVQTLVYHSFGIRNRHIHEAPSNFVKPDENVDGITASDSSSQEISTTTGDEAVVRAEENNSSQDSAPEAADSTSLDIEECSHQQNGAAVSPPEIKVTSGL